MAALSGAFETIIPFRFSMSPNIARRVHLLLLVTFWAGAGIPAQADPASVPADTLMALYAYNFAKFTEWPATAFDDPASPLNFCVLGEDPFGVGALAAVAGQKVGSHPVRIRQYPRVAAIKGCHIVFVSRSEQWRLDSILEHLQSLPVLTVSDIEGFSRRGGMITLVPSAQRLRFDINPAAAQAAGLRLSSKLLELARMVASAPERDKR